MVFHDWYHFSKSSLMRSEFFQRNSHVVEKLLCSPKSWTFSSISVDRITSSIALPISVVLPQVILGCLHFTFNNNVSSFPGTLASQKTIVDSGCYSVSGLRCCLGETLEPAFDLFRGLNLLQSWLAENLRIVFIGDNPRSILGVSSSHVRETLVVHAWCKVVNIICALRFVVDDFEAIDIVNFHECCFSAWLFVAATMTVKRPKSILLLLSEWHEKGLF